MKLSFSKLRRNYSSGRIAGSCGNYANQCAIRMSAALRKTGFRLGNYEGSNVCRADYRRHIRGAESLANFIWKKMGRPIIFKSGTAARSYMTGRKGIVFFKDIEGFRNGRGDHIDLWDIRKTITGDYTDDAKQIWFWELK